MKIYAELYGNIKKHRIKNRCDNKMIAVESLSSVTQTLDNVTTGVDNTLMTGNIKSVVEEACRISPKLSDYGINFILLFFYYTIYMYDNHYWCSSFFYLFTV